jgi:hypothetical protein
MNSVYLFIKLALLAFYPDNTKITIDENYIYFRKPGLTQGFMRWSYGESRNDILKIKPHLKNILFILSNGNFQNGDGILYFVCKAINKLKLCYVDTQEIKDFLCILEKEIIEFYNNKGKHATSIHINPECFKKKVKQILSNWKYTDITFLNHNFKCIIELETCINSSFKLELKQNYIKMIEQFLDHKQS